MREPRIVADWIQARRARRRNAALRVVTVASIVGGALLWTAGLGMVGR